MALGSDSHPRATERPCPHARTTGRSPDQEPCSICTFHDRYDNGFLVVCSLLTWADWVGCQRVVVCLGAGTTCRSAVETAGVVEACSGGVAWARVADWSTAAS